MSIAIQIVIVLLFVWAVYQAQRPSEALARIACMLLITPEQRQQQPERVIACLYEELPPRLAP